MQNVLNYIDKDINEKHRIKNGNIIMSISTDSTANNDHNIGGGYQDEEVNSKSKKIEKTAIIRDIIEVVQTMKHKKENKNKIQIHKGNNNVQNSNTRKTMENLDMESEYRAGSETDRKDNYLYTLNLNTVTNIICIQ